MAARRNGPHHEAVALDDVTGARATHDPLAVHVLNELRTPCEVLQSDQLAHVELVEKDGVVEHAHDQLVLTDGRALAR
eukprot:13294-Pyramimonas_sp.AAC.1